VKVIEEKDLQSVALVTQRIQAEPSTITLRVGQSIGLDAITVTAFDSAGKLRGRLVGYDFSIKPGEPASAVPRKITGDRVGETELIVRFPRLGWRARTDPRAEAKVRVVVKP
jgi:hypothetical protein